MSAESGFIASYDLLIDMKYITSVSGMTDKWFYSLIKSGKFPKPLKLGRSSRWRKSVFEQWLFDREKVK